MKLFLASTLASAAIGIATFASTETAAPCEVSCTPCPLIEDCDASVECLPDGTCRVECENSAGETCWAIIDCNEDGSCKILDSSGDCERLPSAPSDCCMDDAASTPACEASASAQACPEGCD